MLYTLTQTTCSLRIWQSNEPNITVSLSFACPQKTFAATADKLLCAVYCCFLSCCWRKSCISERPSFHRHREVLLTTESLLWWFTDTDWAKQVSWSFFFDYISLIHMSYFPTKHIFYVLYTQAVTIYDILLNYSEQLYTFFYLFFLFSGIQTNHKPHPKGHLAWSE